MTHRTAQPHHETIRAMFAAWAFDADDFEIEIHVSNTPANALGLDGGLLVVRRRSSQHERFYATGPGSALSGALFMDLARGHFGVPAAHNQSRDAFV